MVRRKLMAAVLTAVVPALLAAPGPAQAKVNKPCLTRGQTIAANSTTRVFSVTSRGGTSFVDYACRYHHKQIYKLGRGVADVPISSPWAVTLNGHYVAFEANFACEEDGSCDSGAIHVVNAATGKVVHTAAVGEDPVDEIVVTGAGAVAWTVDGTVQAIGRGGRSTLDPGPDVAGTSLALGGGDEGQPWQVFWLNRSTARSAVLR